MSQVSNEVKELQSSKVIEIENAIQNKDIVVFKSPTGSGKTYMIAELVNRMMSKPENQDKVFFISTLSTGGLPKQMEGELLKYKKKLSLLDPCLLQPSGKDSQERNVIETKHNIYILPRSLFMNGRTIVGNIIPPFENLVDTLLRDNKKIIWIRDECHQATNVIDDYKEKFYKTINFSATPEEYLKKLGKINGRFATPDVVMTESEAVNAHLIKQPKYVEFDDIDENTYLTQLRNAVDKYKAVKVEYLDTYKGIGINPCLVIQISDKKGKGIAQDVNEMEERVIRTVLAENPDIHYLFLSQDTKKNSINATNDNTFMKMNPDQWSSELRRPQCTIDVVIFKQVIKEGYDIPRACILFQIRRIKSETFTQQVIGRVRRNPVLLGFEDLSEEQQHTVLDNCFIYGQKPSDTEREIIKVQNKKPNAQNISIKTTIISNPSFKQATDTEIKKIFDSGNQEIKESIFDTYQKCNSLNQSVKNYYKQFVKSYDDWFKFMDKADEINRKYKIAIEDYDKTMKVSDREYSLSEYSENEKTAYYYPVSNWLWKRTDNEDEFYFDSQAEKDFAKILSNISGSIKNETDSDGNTCYFWAKNFLSSSDIRFEYYFNGSVHSSYPDFILKAGNSEIHLFETKSINKSASQEVDDQQYKEKVDALKKAYMSASKLLPYHFWIPVQKGTDWSIMHYFSGNEEECSLSEMKNMIKK